MHFYYSFQFTQQYILLDWSFKQDHIIFIYFSSLILRFIVIAAEFNWNFQKLLLLELKVAF